MQLTRLASAARSNPWHRAVPAHYGMLYYGRHPTVIG